MRELKTHLVTVGGPSILTAWGFALLRDAAAMVDPPIQIRVIDRADEVETTSARADFAPVLYVAQFASKSLRDYVRDAEPPTVVFLDDPIDSTRYQMSLGVNVVEALRTLTGAAASYEAFKCDTSPYVKLICRSERAEARGTIDSILDHFHIRLTETALHQLYEKFIGANVDASLEAALAHVAPQYQPLDESESSFSQQDIQLIRETFTPIVQMVIGIEADPIKWPTGVFLSGDRHNEPASLVAELTGGARFLYYGPYLYLPAGHWKARIVMGFTEAARGTRLIVEIVCGVVIMKGTMNASESGVFYAPFAFHHVSPEQPIELRIAMDRGAIDGQIALGEVEFTRDAEFASPR